MAKSGVRAHYVIEDAMEHLYDVTVFGETILTTVTKHPEAVAEWIREVLPDDVQVKRLIGFEVSHIGGAENVLGTVQFCVGRRCLVIQIHRLWRYPLSLEEFLSNPKNTFVSIDIIPKLALLTKELCSSGPVKYRDLSILAARLYQRPDLKRAALSEVAVTALGMGLGLEEQPRPESDWGRPGRLSDAQVQYACSQAFVSLELGWWLVRDAHY